jgi:hypothetical protein
MGDTTRLAGSGAGGLAAAVLLAKHAGKRVLVLERHYTAGGFTHVFSRTGFEWDVGLHYIGDVQEPDSGTPRIFDQLTDGRLQWAKIPDIYDRVMMPDRSFDFPSGAERFRERMHSYFPRQARAIDRYTVLRTRRRASNCDTLGTRTPVRGLYLRGQDVAVCGVTGAIAGGILAASAVLRRNMFSVVTKKTNAGIV